MKDSSFGAIMTISFTLLFFLVFNIAIIELPEQQHRHHERNQICRQNGYENTIYHDSGYEINFEGEHYIRCEKTIMRYGQITTVEEWVLDKNYDKLKEGEN